MSTVKRLGRNLQFSFYQRVTTTLAFLFITPFILSRVSHELYGLNALLLSIVGYFRMMDFGLLGGVSRYTAKFIGEEKRSELNELINVGAKIFFIIGIVASLVLLGLSFFYDSIFSVNADIVEEGRWLFYVYAMAAFFVIFGAPFKGVLRGAQRQDIVSKMDIVVDAGKVVFALLILICFRSYLLFIFSLQILTALLIGVIVFQVFRLFSFKLKLSGFSPALYREVVGFSGLYFLLGVFGIIIYQIDNLVIGQFLGFGAITTYSIAFTVHAEISSLNSLLGSPLYFIFATEFARGYGEQLKNMILDSVRMHIGIMLPVLIITIVNVDHFIIAWVGEGFRDAILPARLLLSYLFFAITFYILLDTVIGGLGKIKEVVIVTGLVALANLILSVVFVRLIGIAGVALGTCLPYIIVGPYYIVRCSRHLSIKLTDLFRRTIVPNLPHIALSLVLALGIHVWLKQPNLATVLGLFAASYGVTMALAYTFLTTEQRSIIKRIIRPTI